MHAAFASRNNKAMKTTERARAQATTGNETSPGRIADAASMMAR
jgi:hypothetical protein